MPGVKKLLAHAAGSRRRSRRPNQELSRSSQESRHELLTQNDPDVEAQEPDVEAQVRARPRCHRSELHMMANDEEESKLIEATTGIDATQSEREIQDRIDENQEKAWKKLKQRALGKDSMIDLINEAYKLIDENWLGDVSEFPGNQYTVAAFGFYIIDKTEPWLSSKQQKQYARRLGFVMVWLIQVMGPPAIFGSTAFAWGVPDGHEFQWKNWEVDLSDWEHIATTKALAFIFMLAFILNAIFVILDEFTTWERIDHIFTYLQGKTPDTHLTGERFLYLGAMTNCWVIVWCCIDSIVVLGAAESPKDVIFDALGLIFLFNLDDIGGDLGFINEDDWAGLRLGWIYERITEEEERGDFDWGSRATFGLYKVTITLLYVLFLVLPVLAALTSFTKLVPDT